MLALTLYQASRKATPAHAGFYEGDPIPGFAIHLKKAGIDSTGWAFFNFSDTSSAAEKLPASTPCYSCHAKEGAFDNAFVRFYPILRIVGGLRPPNN